jgi:hypothetical protein
VWMVASYFRPAIVPVPDSADGTGQPRMVFQPSGGYLSIQMELRAASRWRISSVVQTQTWG